MRSLRPIDAQLIALTALGGLSPSQAADALGLTQVRLGFGCIEPDKACEKLSQTLPVIFGEHTP